MYTSYISKQPPASVNGKNSGGKSWVQLVNRKRSGVHCAARSLDKERCSTRGGKRWRRRWGRRRRSRRIKRLWRRRWRWCSTQGQIRRSYIANFSVLAQCASPKINTLLHQMCLPSTLHYGSSIIDNCVKEICPFAPIFIGTICFQTRLLLCWQFFFNFCTRQCCSIPY